MRYASKVRVMSNALGGKLMRPGFLDKIDTTLTGEEIIEWLNSTSYDDLISIDVANDHCVNLYHVDGKYHVPILDGTYREIFEYAVEHMIHPDDREEYRRYMAPETILDAVSQSESPGCLYFKVRYRLQNGEWRWAGKYLFAGSEYGIREGLVITYTFDIQSQVDREQGGGIDKLFAEEQEDVRNEITRLIDEKAFFSHARTLFERPDIADWCVIAIDIQYFRLFNDWYGRSRGDLLLAKIGELLAEAEHDTGGVASYFGQDNFYLLVPFDQQFITRLHRKMTDLFTELNTAYGFRPMFGVCRVEPDAHILDLLDHAKEAQEIARQDVKIGICLYRSKMLEQTNREYEILLEFKNGIRNREFKPYLQPQCNIETGKVIGAEALARWCKPDGTIVSPVAFIPVLEKFGFITDLDCYIWEEVCAMLRTFIDTGREVVPISVNASQADFYAIDVPTFLDELTNKYDIPKSLLEVEVTESTFADNVQTVIDATQRLRDMGFTVLMDDFGSGSSSLNMLSNLNVDAIKLDGGFFQSSGEYVRKSDYIVESIVNMLQNLELPLITEGVETREQVEFLARIGCRIIQGFYFYKPMPVEDFEKLVTANG